ncbi:outer membrane protein assembly factor BamE [Pseudidiomarina sediminum]|uniref:Outer membrane protein assembly factor BamE n=1 Tax=Pseudidiomarina sediminum TaxID=431675 RepID=A0A432Z8W7_9GAMM|nr:outer membrane protein assembly factor BamE [Pseudidiomarina sediminum]MBY6063470.1 outer membrane protein assembly factor BamE [Pseudidiomarina sediminum]RUO74300.1 outer membrane protein assembly factor BamE [Pseudidiomarina sediminum]
MKHILLAGLVLGLSGCSVLEGLVHRIDVPQGNYLEQRDVDRLRVGMTKEQVNFVLGAPVADNAFADDTWYYVFNMDAGDGKDYRRAITLTFVDDRLATYEGDFDRPKEFDTPLEQ